MYFSSRQWGEQLEVRKQSEQKTINPQDVTCFKCQQKPTTLLKSFSLRNIRTCPKFQRAGSAKVARPVNHVSFYFLCVHLDQYIKTNKDNHHWILFCCLFNMIAKKGYRILIQYVFHASLNTKIGRNSNPVCRGQLHIWSQCSWPWSTPWSIAKVYNVLTGNQIWKLQVVVGNISKSSDKLKFHSSRLYFLTPPLPPLLFVLWLFRHRDCERLLLSRGWLLVEQSSVQLMSFSKANRFNFRKR